MKLNYNVQIPSARAGSGELISLIKEFMKSGNECAKIEDIGHYKNYATLRVSLDVAIKRTGEKCYTVSRNSELYLIRGEKPRRVGFKGE